jgi:hypothetical protein
VTGLSVGTSPGNGACCVDRQRQPEVSGMSERNTVVRSLHDLGLGMWFGGSLAGAVGFNGAAADVPDEKLRLRVANAAWARWTPVNFVGIAAHLVGGAGLLYANRDRVAAQQGVAASTVAKAALTGAALGVTAYSRALGKKLEAAEGEPVEGGTEPSPMTSPDIATVQRRLKVCQWLVPGLTAGLHVLNALHGEQQRPQQQLPGILAKPAQLLGIAATPRRSARRPALRAVGWRSRPGGPGVRAALAGAAPAISGLVGGELPKLPRVLAGPTKTPQAPTVTTTNSSNEEPAIVGSANGSAGEFQSATSLQRASEQPRPTPVV